MKKMLILSVFTSFSSNAAVYKPLTITTSLDVSNLYINSIKSVKFVPEVFELTSNKDKRKFDDVNTTLIIETDIPYDFSDVSYVSTLTRNISTCSDYSGESSVQDDFVQLTIDGKNISKEKPVSFLDFNSDDGNYKHSEHSIVLSFKSFKDIVTKGHPEKCYGEIEFNIEVDI
ncbi:hypothetical protein AKJ18_22290 [Vibrio xuii]|nr:hypothetical protein AKJ18_22290 [Vibrio xuii]